MLHVLCRIGQDAYAIPCEAVEKVLPFASLKSLPGSVRGLAGVLNYQGNPLPVVDLSLLLAGQPSREVMGTRILLCPVSAMPSGRLGLLVEEVSEVTNLAEEDFRFAGATSDECLDGVVSVSAQLIQRIEIPGILPPEVAAGLRMNPAFTAASAP